MSLLLACGDGPGGSDSAGSAGSSHSSDSGIVATTDGATPTGGASTTGAASPTDADSGDDGCAGCVATPLCTEEPNVCECGCRGEDQCEQPAQGPWIKHECRTTLERSCFELTPCAVGFPCVRVDVISVACVDELMTCDAVEMAYEAQITDFRAQRCDADEQCHALSGGCEVGLGQCWEVVGLDVTQEQLNALGKRYDELACGGPPCADCGPAPVPRCVRRRCQAG